MEIIRYKKKRGIITWFDWPADVVDVLKKWNKDKELTFVYVLRWRPWGYPEAPIVKCEACGDWFEPEATVGVYNGIACCDWCLIIMARKEAKMADKKKKSKVKEVDVEPGDDTAEAQPSIEREGAAIGSTGGGSSAPGESGGVGSQGNT